MTDGPHIWNVSENIIFELFVASLSDGTGLSGQSPYTSLFIRRDSDGKYWTGNAWSSTLTTLDMTEYDATNQAGRYIYILSAAANSQADRYVGYITIDNAPTAQGNATEIHVSRDQDVKVYESEPA